MEHIAIKVTTLVKSDQAVLIDDGATVEDLLNKMQLGTNKSVTINGEPVSLDTVLESGDSVFIGERNKGG